MFTNACYIPRVPSQTKLTMKTDIWSAALVLVELWTHLLPWQGLDAASIVKKLLKKATPPEVEKVSSPTGGCS